MADILDRLISRSDELSHEAADEIERLRRIFKATNKNEVSGTEGVKRCVMRYAQNRIDLAKVKKEIDALIFKEGEWRDIDLSGHRTEWIEQGYAWHSWTKAVEHAEEEPNDGEMELARLLDKKKSIKRECGDIKRRIYNLGRLMLKNA